MGTMVFVYNADRGLLSALAAVAHRFLAPDAYQCRLGAITGSILGPKRRWKRFVASLDTSVEFLYRNELRRSYAIDTVPLPAVFLRREGQLHLAVASDAINRCRTIDELEELVSSFVLDS